MIRLEDVALDSFGFAGADPSLRRDEVSPRKDDARGNDGRKVTRTFAEKGLMRQHRSLPSGMVWAR